MPRTIDNVFIKNLTFEKLISAHERAKTNKGQRAEVLSFDFNLESNIVNLIKDIKNNKYKLGKYREFTIYEPKERLIRALPYIDRVVHQWYVEEFIKPYFVPKFINDSYACITGRGTHKAVGKVQHYMKVAKRNYGDEYYILKMDIKKFFYNIDQRILYKILCQYIKDKKLLEITKLLLFNDDKVGIPIGNYTSQYFANIYLNELDMYVKHILRIKYYVRYMDDFILLVRDKEEARKVYEKIKFFLNEKLKLELNSKSRYYPNKMGVNFCGFRIWSTHRLLRNRSKRKIKGKIKKWNDFNDRDSLDKRKAIISLKSWLNHAKHANSYKLTVEVLSGCNFLY